MLPVIGFISFAPERKRLYTEVSNYEEHFRRLPFYRQATYNSNILLMSGPLLAICTRKSSFVLFARFSGTDSTHFTSVSSFPCMWAETAAAGHGVSHRGEEQLNTV